MSLLEAASAGSGRRPCTPFSTPLALDAERNNQPIGPKMGTVQTGQDEAQIDWSPISLLKECRIKLRIGV